MIRTLTQCSMVITAIVLLTLMLPATAQTQAMNPDTLLETPEILNDLNREHQPTPERNTRITSPSAWARITTTNGL